MRGREGKTYSDELVRGRVDLRARERQRMNQSRMTHVIESDEVWVGKGVECVGGEEVHIKRSGYPTPNEIGLGARVVFYKV